jgi:multiple sugar transport system permease protein
MRVRALLSKSRFFLKPPFPLLIPAVLILFSLGIYPTVFSFYISFHRYSLAKPWLMPFIGLKNYSDLLGSDVFITSIRITLMFTLAAVTIEFLLGLAIAMLLNRKAAGVGILTVILSLPILFPATLSAVIFRYMFSPLGGVLTYYLQTVFRLPIEFAAVLSYPQGALLGILAIEAWQWTPFIALVLLYGLQSVRVDLIEAAKIDGASSFQLFRHITLPMLREFIAIVIVLRTMDCLKVFDIIFPLTYGGPGLATTTYSFLIYLKGFAFLDIGSASAMAAILLIIMTILAQIYIKVIYRGEKI